MRPGVNVLVTNGNLNLAPANENGTSVVLVASPAAPVAGYGVAFSVSTLAEVKTAFAQVGNEPVIAAFEKGFYAEAAEGTKVYVLAMAQATPLATLFSAANAEKALNLAAGNARLVAAIKFPAGGYTPTIATGFDEDVFNAVTAGQTLGNAWGTKHKGFRFFVQGYGFTTAGAALDGRTRTDNRAFIVVGSVADSTATATLLALGRAAKVNPQINIGRVKSGSLNIAAADAVKIGNTVVDAVSDADKDLLHDKCYITFEKNEAAPGYIFNNDKAFTAVDDDYNNLRYGRVIDNAQRVAYKAYYEELKDDVDVDENGRLEAVTEQALAVKVRSAIELAMPGQLSTKKDGSADVFALVNPDPTEYASLYAANSITPNLNIIQSETIYLFLFVKPRGSLTYIRVYLGLTATDL